MRSALLVIDVQRALFDVVPRPFDADAVISRINLLSKRARASGVPVLFIQHESPGSVLVRGGAGWELQRDLAVHAGDQYVSKTTPDSFLRTDLDAVLTRAGISRVVVCGYASEFCIDTTVRRAAGLGYEVTLVSDAHTTHDKPHASAVAIRDHENFTLPAITSFGPAIDARPTDAVAF